MSHNCQNVLVRCVDFRIDAVVRAWLESQSYLNETDLVSVAGSCKDFVADPSLEVSQYLFQQIDLSYNLHNMRRVILTQHEDCGAYGGTEKSGGIEEEKKKLIADMDNLKEQLIQKYTDLEVKTLWFKKQGNGWQTEELK